MTVAEAPRTPTSRVYGGLGRIETVSDVAAVDILLPSLAQAQIGTLASVIDKDGFLIRVWPPEGTHEFGGTNGTAISLLITFKDGVPTVESLNIDAEASSNYRRNHND